jgi:hypothetical protein
MKKIKSLLKKIPGVRALADIAWEQKEIYKSVGLKESVLLNIILSVALLRYNLKKKRYRILPEDELLKTRTSDKAFVFGSGYSLHQISDDQWRHFEKHNTIGFSGFIHQKWVRVDYELIRGWVEIKGDIFGWRNYTGEFADTLRNNPFFDNAILIMQGDYKARFCNRLLGYDYIREGQRIYRYKTVRHLGLPTKSLQEGLRHGRATLCDAVNFAFCMGYKEIVLVGVDLYDCRYFWVSPDKTERFDKNTCTFVEDAVNTRGLRFNEQHNTVINGLIEEMNEWNKFLKKHGVKMSVYNPRSLLRRVLPLYDNTNKAEDIP